MKRLFLLSLFASRLCAQTDYMVNITEPESGVVGVSYTGWAGKLTINVDGANPDDISADPTSYTVRDAIYGVKGASLFTSNRDSENGGVLQNGISAMTFNMNSGVIKSFIGAADTSKIYGDSEINVRGGLIYTVPGEWEISAPAIALTDRVSSSVEIYGDSKINMGSTGGGLQPRIYGTVFAMGAGVLYGNTEVVIAGGTYGAYRISSGIFAGAAWGGTIKGNSGIRISGGDFSESYVYGGSFGEDTSQASVIEGSSSVVIDGGTLSTVYSGNYNLSNLEIKGDASMSITAGDVANAYGGGGTVSGDVRTEIVGGNVGNAYGNYGTVGGNSQLSISGGTVGNAYAASYGAIDGKSVLRMDGGTVTGNLVGTFQGTARGDVEIIVEKGNIGGDIIGVRGNAQKNVNIIFLGNSEEISFSGTVRTYYENDAFWTGKFSGRASLQFGNSEMAFIGDFGGSADGYGNLDIRIGDGSAVRFTRALEGVSDLIVGENAEAVFAGESSVEFENITMASNARVTLDATALSLAEDGIFTIVLASDFDITRPGNIEMSALFDLENAGKAFFQNLTPEEIRILASDGEEFEGSWEVAASGDGMFSIMINVPEPSGLALIISFAALVPVLGARFRGRNSG